MESEIRVLIADDHPIVRQGLRQSIHDEPDLQIVGEAGDGKTALRLIQELLPGIAVLDIAMPQMDGFAVAAEVFNRNLNVDLVFLTAHREESLFKRALELGIRGYVLKESVMSDIVASIRAVAAGQTYISPMLAGYLIDRRETPVSGLGALTQAELRILKLIAGGKSSKEIAAELFISYYTVETHRKNICERLGLRGAHALVRFAVEHKAELL
jgi:DNA-binding NarL/FixJ family response regulator